MTQIHLQERHPSTRSSSHTVVIVANGGGGASFGVSADHNVLAGTDRCWKIDRCFFLRSTGTNVKSTVVFETADEVLDGNIMHNDSLKVKYNCILLIETYLVYHDIYES